MDITAFWDQLITKWKEEEKCGLCWADFEAPLVESQSNIVQVNPGEECCVQTFLTNISFREVPSYSPQTTFENGTNKDWTFDVHFLTQGDLSTNNFQEIKGYEKSEGRWNTVYNPIRQCLDRREIEQELCLYLGLRANITTWDLTMPKQAYLDNNYFGWKLKITLRIAE